MPDSVLTDPLGRAISLHDRTWFGHILKRHDELTAERERVENALSKPLQIRFSDADPVDGRLYFGTGPRAGMMIVVVADIALGLVKTAHLVKRFKGVIEWSPPTP